MEPEVKESPFKLALMVLTILASPILAISPNQETAFDPARQRSLGVEDAEFKVALARRDACTNCPSVSRFVFMIKEKAKGEQRTFALENETAQVDEVHLTTSGILVVVGRVLANTNIVTLVDLRAGRLRDAFFCYNPKVSPDGRFVAYVKVFPAHFAKGVSAIYVLYDLGESPAGNRPQGVSIENRIDVGRAFFPIGSRNRPGDNLNVDPVESHTMASESFYWSADSRGLAFADRAEERNWIVQLESPERPAIRKVAIETLEVVDPENCGELRDRLETSFHVVDIKWLSKAEVSIRFRSLNPKCLKRETTKVTIPS